MWVFSDEARNLQCFRTRAAGISLARALLCGVFTLMCRSLAASAGMRSGSNVTGGASVAASELETQKTLVLVLRGVFKEELRFLIGERSLDRSAFQLHQSPDKPDAGVMRHTISRLTLHSLYVWGCRRLLRGACIQM